MGTVAVKNVDENLFRRVKALASLEGKTMGEEVNDALATWLSQRTSDPELLSRWEELEKEALVNNRVFEKLRMELTAEHPGEFAVVTSGKLAGVFKRKEDALREASKSGGKRGIVAHLVERKEPRVMELGGAFRGEATGYSLSRHEVSTESDADNAAYAAAKNELLRKHAGRYVVFWGGAFRGAADSLEGAAALVRAAGRSRALVMKMGEEIPTGGDWLWSSLDLSAA